MDNKLIVAAMNSVQVTHELKLLKTGDEEHEFSVALQGQKLEKKSVDELTEVLRMLMLKAGLRAKNLPNELETEVLIAHIFYHYSNHTIEEIRLAFEMAMMGKLEVEERGKMVTLNASCFENFSCVYFSMVMNAYRRWAREAYHHLPAPQMKVVGEKKELTDDEMQEWVDSWVLNIKSVTDPALVPTLFYDWLEKKEKLVLTKEQKQDYFYNQAMVVRHFHLAEQARGAPEGSRDWIALQEFNKMQEEGWLRPQDVEKLKVLAKKISVFDYLNDLHDLQHRQHREQEREQQKQQAGV